MQLTLILDNIRSAYNVGAIFRSADIFAVHEIILTGVSPYPIIKNDRRLPHVRDKAQRMIAKTALGAEKTVPFLYIKTIAEAIERVKAKKLPVYALEQHKNSIDIREFVALRQCALIVGSEINGVANKILGQCNQILQIPQYGSKESLNVSVATGIALFELSKKSGR